MTSRSRANEIPRLIEQLGDSNRVRVDSAKARLSVIGARAVEALIEALEADHAAVRLHAMQLLAFIRDPRGREPLKAMLFDGCPETRAAAARAVAKFPSADSAATLERLLRRAAETEVRAAAIEALVEVYSAGQESALAPVLGVLLDPDEDAAVRRSATAVLPRLPANERRSLKHRLDLDAEPEVATAAGEAIRSSSGGSGGTPDVRHLLDDLADDDYAAWDSAVQRLTAIGSPAVEPLVRRMRRRAQSPEFCTRVGMVLKAIGPRRGRVIGELVESVDEPLPLSVLVEVIGSYGVNALTYRLANVIESLAERRAAASSSAEIELLERVRAKAHLELARIGSRVAIQDLREALGDERRRVEVEILAAVELIGKKDELLDLIRAWKKEDDFMRDRIGAVVRAVMRRERIRRNSVALRSLGEEPRATLSALLDRHDVRRASRRDR